MIGENINANVKSTGNQCMYRTGFVIAQGQALRCVRSCDLSSMSKIQLGLVAILANDPQRSRNPPDHSSTQVGKGVQ